MMSPEEHKLMLGMFTEQIMVIKSLVTALRSVGVLEADDLNAFAFVESSQEEEVDPAISRAVVSRYISLAKAHGMNLEVSFS
jgi:hypothetical protein